MRQQRCHISLSLSLSLCRQASSGLNARFGARNGARHHLLEVPRRGNTRGLCRSVCERPAAGGWALMSLPPPEDARVPMRRPGPLGPQGGGAYLSRVQYTRLLDGALAVIAEEGLRGASATRVSARAGMSTKSFYDLFANREDCFLAVFDRTVEELAAAAGPVWARGRVGRARPRCADRVAGGVGA